MKVFITTVTGAIIGYITNWLAIKMLFRPYEEKRFLGFKIPFTPGLIPKEKGRIAKSVGEAIGNHLLTKETMVKSLCSEKINKKLEQWVFNKIDSLKESENSLGNLVEEFSEGKQHELYKYLSVNLNNYILNSIRNEKSKNAMVKYIEEYIEESLNKSPKVLTESSIYNKINEKLLCVALEYKNEGKIEEKLNSVFMEEIKNLEGSSKKIKDIIPQSAVNNLKVYMYNKKDNICAAIEEILNSEKAQIKVRDIIEEAISKNLNPMIAMFLNKESLYEKAMVILNDFMEKEENKQEVIVLLGEIVDKILEKDVSDILVNSSEEGKEETIKVISRLISDKFVSEENVKSLENVFKDKINNNNNLRDIIIKLNKKYSEDLNKLIHKKLDEFLFGEVFCGKLLNIIENFIKSVFDKPMKDIFKGREEAIKKYSYAIAISLYNRFIEREAESVIEALDIAAITEERINSFDVAFAEKIILEISSKELSAITWLGGLLGGIMGLVSSLIASL
ncbi:DUF445 family protein [Haloimpatiens lingqiaonensis]|uniref:DUF445 family protein n=1 Tax=Haloimpatiens lingqiaonensis TaxID=1380675 RepID=UPI0010FE6F8C|nr:DUF445 family protein [Haloimpatiens lingqiaonensis]